MRQRGLTMMLILSCAVLGVVAGILYLGQDRQAPIISIEEETFSYQEDRGDNQFLQGVSAEDNRDGDLSEEIFIDKVVPTDDGRAVVYYGVLDKSKNVGRASRIVNYGGEAKTEEDEETAPSGEAPVLTLNTSRVTIDAGTEFDVMSVIEDIVDTEDEWVTLSRQVNVDGDYDTNVPGTYTLIYSALDSDGNASKPEELTLVVR